MTTPLISLDEFGQDLFAAIKAQAGAIQATKSADLYAAKGLPVQEREYAAHAKACQVTLQGLLEKGTIATQDVRRILGMT